MGTMVDRSPVARAFATGLSVSLVLGLTIGSAASATAGDRKPADMVLNSLPVSIEMPAGYDRSLFRLWVDANGDGCDTREEVLIVEAVAGQVAGCGVIGGRWYSAYDGKSTTNSRTFDIDHRVPLKEAWDSGAWRWDGQTRQAYANDLGFADSLIAVSASSNRSKSDRDPAEWMPTLGACDYAKTWIAVKFRWRLSVDTTEKSALGRILNGCSPLMLVPDLAATSNQTNTPLPSEPNPATTPSNDLDPRFRTCGEANGAGFGPYVRGTDPEYSWYIDRDKDGVVCER